MKKLIFLIIVLQALFTVSIYAQDDKLTIKKLKSGTIVYSLKSYKMFKEEKIPKKHYGSLKYDNITDKYRLELGSFANDKINSIGWPFEGEKFVANIFDRIWPVKIHVTINNKGKVVVVSVFADAHSKLKDAENLKELLKAIGTWDKPYYNKFNAPENTYLQWGI